ncbi:MAG: metallophosphoesterase [bacterium]|nr:metallophosphoesterase [bacterium]
MSRKKIFQRLCRLYESTSCLDISDKDSLVIFSDLHIGDGGSLDDFAGNAGCFSFLLNNYYEPKNFSLILNGDIEELHRFQLNQVLDQWKEIYDSFDSFKKKNRFFKLFGNHDFQLTMIKKQPLDMVLKESLRLRYGDNEIFVFHGHQGGRFNIYFNLFAGYVLRFLATPLRIKNYAVAYSSKKKYALEQRIYGFAADKKVLAIIGHTHRPLFESLSKIDSLKFNLEALCRLYPTSDEAGKESLVKQIKELKKELERLKEKKDRDKGSLYASEPLVPCIFNSGCGIGESGITSIEISNGMIRLVYWFDRKRTQKYFDYSDFEPEQLKNSDYFRVVLKEEPLDYIFTRVKLLA